MLDSGGIAPVSAYAKKICGGGGVSEKNMLGGQVGKKYIMLGGGRRKNKNMGSIVDLSLD